MPEEMPASAPKTFVSYSWSSPTHQSWVVSLAARLRGDGVDVILDKWDLKPGHDSYKFMESMVTDPDVRKVIMICDRVYAEKADARSGGVGTESQIISPEIYGSSTQDKFAAVIVEDDDGKAYVPTFYKGRVYFDFRSGDRFEEAYEELLRWLVDRPQFVKPKLGSVPSAILTVEATSAATRGKAKRAEESLRRNASTAPANIRDYGDAFIPELQAHAITVGNGEPADEKVLTAVAAMRPYVRQFVELCTVTARYAEDMRPWDTLLNQLERVGRLMFRGPELNAWHQSQFDAYKMICHETFLSIIAVALDEERFDLAAATLARPWLVRENDGSNRRSTSDYTVFNQSAGSIRQRNERLKLNRISLEADLLHEAHRPGSQPSFESLLQADLVVFLRSFDKATEGRWFPFPLVYACDRYAPFPVFARSEARGYFQKLAPVLNVPDLEAFKLRLKDEALGRMTSQMFDYHGLPLSYLVNTEHLGTRA